MRLNFSLLVLFLVALFFQNCGKMDPTSEQVSDKTSDPNSVRYSIPETEQMADFLVKSVKDLGRNSGVATSIVDRILKKNLRSHLGSFRGNDPIVWSHGATLEALVELHKISDDSRIIDELIEQGDVILSGTSRKRGQRDAVRGKTVYSWVTGRYSCGKLYSWAAHTGVITLPLAYTVRAILDDAKLVADARYLKAARRFLTGIERAMNVHKGYFRNKGSSGTYIFPSAINKLKCSKTNGFGAKALPINMSAAMGRTHIELYRLYRLSSPLRNLSKAKHHGGRARRIAKYFASLLKGSGSGYKWVYHGDATKPRSEDTAHGALDIRFATEIYLNGLGFSSTYMKKFAKTFLYVAGNGTTTLKSHVDPKVKQILGKYVYAKSAVKWVSLAKFNSAVYTKAQYIYDKFSGGKARDLLNEVLLLKWRSSSSSSSNSPTPAPTPTANSSTKAAHFEIGPVYNPSGALGSGITGLYRTTSDKLFSIAGKKVSSCVRYRFAKSISTGKLSFSYRHTKIKIAGDTCSGSSCGTNPGLYAFHSINGKNWSSVSITKPDKSFRAASLSISKFRYVLFCRAGGGAARDNIQIKAVRAVEVKSLPKAAPTTPAPAVPQRSVKPKPVKKTLRPNQEVRIGAGLVANPAGAAGGSITGLYRKTSGKLFSMAGKKVSSCARYRFAKNISTGKLSFSYRHTKTKIAGDTCSGNSCGTNPGLYVFRSINGKNWNSISITKPGKSFRATSLSIPKFRYVLFCRAGGGAARDNIQIKAVKAQNVTN